MRKYILVLLLCFSLVLPVYGADQKISELPALGAKPVVDDLLVIYDSNTGITKKVNYSYLEDIKNVNIYDGLTSAVTSFGDVEVTLLIDDAQTVTAHLSIPTTMQLFITRGGSITVSAGQILTINGTILAGAYQIFGSTGTVTFSGNGIAYNNWWSAGGSTYTAGDIFYLDTNKKFSTLAKGGALAIPRMNSGATVLEWGTGGQIVFPANAVPSGDPNTLDDYEEGKFETSITMSGSGTVTLNATNRYIHYTKIGRKIHMHGKIQVSATNTPLGGSKLTIPFTSKNDATCHSGGAMGHESVNLNGGTYLWGLILHNVDYMLLKGGGDGSIAEISIDVGDEYYLDNSYIE